MKKIKKVIISFMMVLFTFSIFSANTSASIAKVQEPADATLKSLKISTGVMTPSFSKEQMNYVVYVNSDVAYVNLTATLNNPRAVLMFRKDQGKEEAWRSGKAKKIYLDDKMTNIEIIVTPVSGDAKVYTVKVYRADANEARLTDIVLLPSEIGDIDFHKDDLEYTLNIPYTYSSVKIIPIAVDSSAKISINKKAVKSGNQSTVSLKTGENVIEIKVINGTGEKVYRLTIIRSKNNNCNLKSLTASPGKMDKRFSKNEFKYNLYLKDTDKKLSITAVPESMDAKVAVTAMLDGNDVKVNIKGNKYETVLDAVGKYIFSIKVTAEDGITNTTYIIEATKPDISDNKLSNISLSAGKLDKMFDPEKKEYNVFVENEINKIVVDAVPYNPNSVVRIYSIDSNKYLGSNKVNIALNEGMNKIRIDVYGHDGNKTPNSYKLSITRLPQPVLDITGVEYSDDNKEIKDLPDNRISYKNNEYLIDLTGLKDTYLIKSIKVNEKYVSKIKFQNNKVVVLNEGNNTLNDLCMVGLEDNGEKGVSVGVLKNNADSNGYITVSAELIGQYQGYEIKKDVVFKAKVKEARKESGINNIVNSMKLKLSNSEEINALINKGNNNLTFNFEKLQTSQEGLYVTNAVINVKRDCVLEIGNRFIELKMGDNILTIEDLGFIDNGDNGVSIEFLKKLGNISQSCTITDLSSKGSIEYVVTLSLKW